MSFARPASDGDLGGVDAWEQNGSPSGDFDALDNYDDTKYLRWHGLSSGGPHTTTVRAVCPTSGRNIAAAEDITAGFINVRIRRTSNGGTHTTGTFYVFVIADDGSYTNQAVSVLEVDIPLDGQWHDVSFHSSEDTHGPGTATGPALWVQYTPGVGQTDFLDVSHVSFGDAAESAAKIITITSDANSAWDQEGAVSAAVGSTPTFTLTPASGYEVADVLVDSVSVGDAVGDATYPYTFTAIAADHTLAGSARGATQTITLQAQTNKGGITVDNASPRTGDTVRYTITPSPGRRITSLTRNGVSVAADINPIYGVTNQTRMDILNTSIQIDDVVDSTPAIFAATFDQAAGVGSTSYTSGLQTGFGLEDFAKRRAMIEGDLRHRADNNLQF